MILGVFIGQHASPDAAYDKLAGETQVEALLFVADRQEIGLDRFNVFGAQNVATEVENENYRRRVAVQIKSRQVAAALRDPKIAQLGEVQMHKDQVTWLHNNLSVERTESPEILRITLSGRNEADLVLLLNSLLDAFKEQLFQEENNARLERIQTLKNFSQKYEERLRSGLSSFRMRILPFIDRPSDQDQLLRERRATFSKELIRVDLAIIVLESKLTSLKAISQVEGDTKKAEEPIRLELASLREQKKTLLQQQDAMREELIAVEAQKDETEKLIFRAKKLRELLELATLDLEMNNGSRVRVLERASAAH
jgi:hypothetical protein